MNEWFVRVGHERDLRPVRRPPRITVGAPGRNERLFTLVDFAHLRRRRGAGAIDLPVLHIENETAVRRELRRRALGDAEGGCAAGCAHGPDLARRPIGVMRRVRDPSLAVRRRSAHEDHHAAVVRDRHVGDVDAVVLEEPRQPHRLEVRRRGGVDVPHSPIVGHPGESIRLLRRDEVERRRGAHELLDGWFVLGSESWCQQGNGEGRSDETAKGWRDHFLASWVRAGESRKRGQRNIGWPRRPHRLQDGTGTV